MFLMMYLEYITLLNLNDYLIRLRLIIWRYFYEIVKIGLLFICGLIFYVEALLFFVSSRFLLRFFCHLACILLLGLMHKLPIRLLCPLNNFAWIQLWNLYVLIISKIDLKYDPTLYNLYLLQSWIYLQVPPFSKTWHHGYNSSLLHPTNQHALHLHPNPS